MIENTGEKESTVFGWNMKIESFSCENSSQIFKMRSVSPFENDWKPGRKKSTLFDWDMKIESFSCQNSSQILKMRSAPPFENDWKPGGKRKRFIWLKYENRIIFLRSFVRYNSRERVGLTATTRLVLKRHLDLPKWRSKHRNSFHGVLGALWEHLWSQPHPIIPL